jgi:hypothetical protein
MSIPNSVGIQRNYSAEAEARSVVPSALLPNLLDWQGVGDDVRALRAALTVAWWFLEATRHEASDEEMLSQVVGLAEVVAARRALDFNTDSCDPVTARLRAALLALVNDRDCADEGYVKVRVVAEFTHSALPLRDVLREVADLSAWVEPHVPTWDEMEDADWLGWFL